MKEIKLIFSILLFLASINGYSQDTNTKIVDSTFKNSSEDKEKIDYKFFDKSYDETNNRLRRVNDTLNVFIGDEKKISLTSLNIIKLENFEGFEKDIDPFLTVLGNVNLDLENGSYTLNFRPETNELIVSERNETRYKSVDGLVLPIYRHEVTFTYFREMLEIKFYLGEIDEMLVLKDSGFTELIKKEGNDNEWFSTYGKIKFNKDLKIKADGSSQVVTYKNMERTPLVDFGSTLGVSFLGNLFPVDLEFYMNFRVKRFNKWTQQNNGFFISYDIYSFISRNSESRFITNESFFINSGMLLGSGDNPIRIYYGRLVFADPKKDILINNKNKIGVEIFLNRLIKIKSEVFFGSSNEADLISLGVDLNLFSTRD